MSQHRCPECGRTCECEDVESGEDCSHCPVAVWDDEEFPDDDFEPVKPTEHETGDLFDDVEDAG